MPKTDLLDIQGKKGGQIELPKEIFAAKINPPLMAQAIRVYLSNQRKARAKARHRGEVTGSTKKIWRQKGTGHARHGDRQAPIFVGGGKAHGPTGTQNYNLKISKKMKKAALFSALTSKFKDEQLKVIKGLAAIEPKTKQTVKILKNLKIDLGTKVMIVIPEKIENLIRSARNIKGVTLIKVNQINTYEILNTGQLILMKESLELMEKNLISDSKKA